MSNPSSSEDPGVIMSRRMARDARRLFPQMDDPEYTRGEIYRIYKLKIPDIDVAAGMLAGIFGLSETVLGRERAQGLFRHPEFIRAFVDFSDIYLRGKWDLPVGDWMTIHHLIHDHPDHKEWHYGSNAEKGWTVNCYYARFVTHAIYGLNQTTKNTKQLAFWVRDAPLCHQIWVLMHALMYLQLVTMRDSKKNAPVKDRISHFVEGFKADTPAKTEFKISEEFS
ncbi:uncharacterized protein F4822DRAFT_418549 [Hypoxylon trugodes]|uniref:uncharacterized protein n=1 Tax=Hypoxylon trugodes TaxID=326681 RepID=UPI0021903265|nr:uncharacterized protein F4822DRAFT_418549 [Hypoxylon trugodes]KAI1384074.1 hypothetical protein F4822DRAFT_418549 [Hypoxylon trugodes]